MADAEGWKIRMPMVLPQDTMIAQGERGEDEVVE